MYIIIQNTLNCLKMFLTRLKQLNVTTMRPRTLRTCNTKSGEQEQVNVEELIVTQVDTDLVNTRTQHTPG